MAVADPTEPHPPPARANTPLPGRPCVFYAPVPNPQTLRTHPPTCLWPPTCLRELASSDAVPTYPLSLPWPPTCHGTRPSALPPIPHRLRSLAPPQACLDGLGDSISRALVLVPLFTHPSLFSPLSSLRFPSLSLSCPPPLVPTLTPITIFYPCYFSPLRLLPLSGSPALPSSSLPFSPLPPLHQLPQVTPPPFPSPPSVLPLPPAALHFPLFAPTPLPLPPFYPSPPPPLSSSSSLPPPYPYSLPFFSPFPPLLPPFLPHTLTPYPLPPSPLPPSSPLPLSSPLLPLPPHPALSPLHPSSPPNPSSPPPCSSPLPTPLLPPPPSSPSPPTPLVCQAPATEVLAGTMAFIASADNDEEQAPASSGASVKARLIKRGRITATAGGVPQRASVSVKRPLDLVLPCQEIQYLDISYQKVGTVTHILPQVQFSPIPRKKIAYHPVLHNSIHYCDVPYCGTGERPVKRKPLQRSHSIAVADLRERVDCEWTSSYKLRSLWFAEELPSHRFTNRGLITLPANQRNPPSPLA
ncbi:hypothetical protein C7M84_011715 [Penaeus vannamei]|uniref:Uncharacterized protein n=1 Tax=Penaeus vannamei TaxID=6689 RepID=A0A423T0Q5_PENVA|nr:hypothetical protein C7M84_011715 [Penaeus vannamei]